MKRIAALSFFYIVIFLLPISISAGGINNAADLVAFATAINTGQSIDQWRNENGEVCLEADIDMAKVKKFESISSFGGVFDGKGYSIRNWKAKSGLFDQLLQGGIIRNLIIDESCSMKATNENEEYFCGFIANRNNGLIENCKNYGSISHKSKYTEYDIYIGGIAGSNRWGLLRCDNYGNITSDCVATLQKWGVAINIGGVVGGGYDKMEKKPSISWCSNYGKITYSGDSPSVNVAGVVGSCEKKIPLKYCVNRGDVVVSAQSTEGDRKIRSCYAGGVCAFTKGNLVDSDNFGNVSSSGTHPTAVAGVIAYAHATAVISGCVNYGSVSMTTAAASDMGGVVGMSRRAVHVNNCQNHGEVIYDGYSPDAPSTVGGIIGQAYTVGDAKSAAYIRSCVNYGKVFSGTGGNNYENNKAIKTGGIAGALRGNEKVQVVLSDCANFGKVSSLGGRCNPIVAQSENIRPKGQYYDSYAQSAEPREDGCNVFGIVVTDDGKPLEGVVVSDGLQCVKTDAEGRYSMKSNIEKVRFITVSTPSGYEAEMSYSMPQLFRRVRRSEKAVKADFTLKYTGEKEDYTLVIIGDPQMRGLGSDNSGERYRDVVIPDINQLKGNNENFYAIVVGDVVYNWMTGYDDYVDISATASFPTYNMIGNHDMEQESLYDTRLGTGYYENYIGPTYYSFNIGKMHYVVLNTITADHKSASSRHYWYGLDDDQFEWLKNDLSHVSDDVTVVVCAHAILFQNDCKYKGVDHLDGMKEVLERFEKVYAWGGHSHTNYGCDYNLNWNGGKLLAATVSRCNGSIRYNQEMMSNGVPNGYIVADVKGRDMTWQFKCIGKDTDYQMKLYSPERTKTEYVKAHIWNWAANFWTQPEWWENGVKVAELEPVKDYDIDYQESYAAWKQQKDSNQKWGEQKPVSMFRIKPSEGVRAGEVRVTDYFGNTYTQKIEW